MAYHALSCLCQETNSGRAGLAVARAIREGFGRERLKTVVTYATVNHDQAALLRGLREGLGPGVSVVGCSAQGVMTNSAVLEGGFAVAAMGLGGESLRVAAARVDAIHVEGRAKGQALARSLVAQLDQRPQVMMLLYDPLRGVDVNELLAGVREEVSGPVVGGAASQPSGPVSATYQYHGEQAFQGGAVALGLAGNFGADLGVCHGTSPTGISMTLTRAQGNRLLELDGRPALDVWRECVGCAEEDILNQDHTAALAMGVERHVLRNGRQEPVYLIRAAFGFDRAAKAVVVQAAIPEGSTIMFHHRTMQVVKDGTVAMGKELRARLGDKRPWAVLGFECGARTAPFLGLADTVEENVQLQRAVAPHAPWLGLLAWGEIAPYAAEPGTAPEFHNYTYPLLVLSQ
jgi:hypothetical protein